ncbi:MAG: histidine phosphatase family protein [Acidobacteria bacterium]|nr:histidine phosphatase family protein [Acidobacteriota bacterium]
MILIIFVLVFGWTLIADRPTTVHERRQHARLRRAYCPRARAAQGDVALFADGHVLWMLAARWIGLPAGAGQHFLFDTGILCVLDYYRDIPAVLVWNGRLTE